VSLDSLVHRIRPAAGEAAGALLLLHGRGTDEGDLLPVLDFLDPDKRFVGATARAPLTLPPGGYHWYAVHRIGFPDPDTFLSTFDLLSGWVDAFLADQGVPADKLVVGGFSQGGVMSHALTLGPGRPRPAGLLAMSTFMPTVEGFELDLERARDLPVAITHGSHDPIISVDFGREAKERLEAAGARVSYFESEMPHAIDPRVVPQLQEWLAALP
jgi:phospholipase/carboxylesterase